MKTMEEANMQAASTMRFRKTEVSRPCARGHGSASMRPGLQGSANGWALETSHMLLLRSAPKTELFVARANGASFPAVFIDKIRRVWFLYDIGCPWKTQPCIDARFALPTAGPCKVNVR
jgi:hypothetical protein